MGGGRRGVANVCIGVFGAVGTGKSALVSSLVSAHGKQAMNKNRRRLMKRNKHAAVVTIINDGDDSNSENNSDDDERVEGELRTMPKEESAMEYEVILPMSTTTQATIVVIDVPGSFCNSASFFETPDDLDQSESSQTSTRNTTSTTTTTTSSTVNDGDDEGNAIMMKSMGDVDDDGKEKETKQLVKKEEKKKRKTRRKENEDAETMNGSAADIGMICDSVIVCFDPCVPDSVNVADDLLRLLEAQKDPLPLRGVICATRSDRVDVPESAKAAVIERAKDLAEKYGFAYAVTSAIKGREGVDACFRYAVGQTQSSSDLLCSCCCTVC